MRGEGGGRKLCFFIFSVFLALLYLSVDEGCWLGQKVLFKAS